jgi:hypothetical protein
MRFLKDYWVITGLVAFWILLMPCIIVTLDKKDITKHSNYYKMPSEVVVIKTYNYYDCNDKGKNEMTAIQEVLNENEDFGAVYRTECKWQNTTSACYAIWLKKDAKWDKKDVTVEE